MATVKERYQNPTVSDTIRLRLFTYNSNEFASVESIDKVEIYFLDPTNRSEENPDGRRLVEEFNVDDVTEEAEGKYLLEVPAESPSYSIGRYLDVWHLTVAEGENTVESVQCFDIYPNLWYATPIPVVYDFDFYFQPNKIRKGSKQYLKIEIKPNVPRASDLQKYYENLAIVSNLKISLEQVCGPCTPAEEDLRLILDEEDVEFREKRWGYYLLDTEDLDPAVYHIWFKLEMGETVHISPKLQLQIFN
jgi:hypothetical protein